MLPILGPACWPFSRQVTLLAAFVPEGSVMRVVKTGNVISVAPSDLSQALSRDKPCRGVCRKEFKSFQMDVMVSCDRF
jgi:hypothetical protein